MWQEHETIDISPEKSNIILIMLMKNHSESKFPKKKNFRFDISQEKTFDNRYFSGKLM